MRRTAAATLCLMTMLACNEKGVTSVDDTSGVVRGVTYVDRNGDGVFGAGDSPVPNILALLLTFAGGDTVARVSSGANGAFLFGNVAPGAYRVHVELGSMGDSLAIVAGPDRVDVAAGDTAAVELRAGYSALTATVAEARQLPIGKRVTVTGVALNARGAFGDSTVHVMDSTGSVRATQVTGTVAAGDRVRLTGSIGTRGGQPVLRATAVEVVAPGVGVAAADSLSTASAAGAAGGALDAARVSVTGAVVEIEWPSSTVIALTVNDGSGAVIVELHTTAGFSFLSNPVPGQGIRATGVLVPAGGSWRLRPVVAADVGPSGVAVPCSNGVAGVFSCSNVDLLSYIPLEQIGGLTGEALNDIWGWEDPSTGREYAIVGRTHGTSFVDISDPLRPVVVGNLPMTPGARGSSWRDIKVYRDHAFVVADAAGAHGMQVIDLTRLRQFSGTVLQLTADVVYNRVFSAHNIVINEQSGFAFVVGAGAGGETCGQGLHMVDIRTPKSPQFAGCFAHPQTGRAGMGYTHDAQCVIYAGPDGRYSGREICFGSNETALSIADVTDKANPVALAKASYPDVAYSHQAWLTEDQRYLYMNDELDEGGGRRTRTLIWDVADLEDPQLVGQHMGVEASTDHNLYIRGDLMYQANYRSGLRILDITNRTAPEEVGFFDTSREPGNGPGFEGAWSNYPYFDSGVVVVSSIFDGLFVLRPR